MTTRIEGVHPLSPLQQGLLYHTILDPGTSFYVDQVIQTLDGDLDPEALEQAWQRAVDRHTILRSSYHWEEIDEPAQVVRASGTAHIERHDWRDTGSDDAVQERLEDFLRTDRRRGFQLDRPPLFRLHLLRVAEQRHLFVFRYHHILLDAWSALMLLEEVLSSYDDLVRGRQLPSRPVRPYHDYVDWIRRQDMSRAEEFWRTELAGFRPAPLAVTGTEGDDGARAETGADTGRENPEVSLVLARETGEALRRLAREHRLTLGTVLQTAWGLLLSRYTDQQDVVFGMTMTHRPAELDGIEDTLGLFINTLPLRVQPAPHRPFAASCAQVQAAQTRMRGFLSSPLAEVQQWSDAEPGEPLFDSIMTILNVPRIGNLGRRTGELDVRGGEYRYHTNYPLAVLVIPDEEITLRIGYDRSRFDAAAVERMLGHFATILETVATDFTLPAGRISLLTREERRMIDASGAGEAVAPPGLCAQQLFEERAERTPDATAVTFRGTSLAYGQLDARANQLAHLLAEHGIGPESRVGLCLDRSVDLVVAMLGVLKAGGAFVPLDPAYPADRLDFMSRDAELSLLLTSSTAQRQLPRLAVRSILLDEQTEALDRHSTEPVSSGVRPDNLAYVIYTSGSTGRPKGALITHDGLVNSCLAQQDAFGTGPEDRVLQWASPSFDASVFEVFLALGAGAALCLAPQEEVIPGPGLVDLLARESISCLVMAPSALAALPLEAPARLPGLRTIVLGGESVSTTLLDRWCTGRRIFNVYGHTETSIWATVEECAADGRPPSVGRPVRGIQVHLLDSSGQPVPDGVAGELYLGGVGVGRGYLNRPRLTAERFPANPFSDVPGSRLYRSGDLLRRRADGRLDFVGRVDGQAKIRGLRIETGEIESALREHPTVKDAAVMVRAGLGGEGTDQRLVAYLLLRPGDERPAEDWRLFLRTTLPDYMVPNSFVTLDSLPLTSNGKLDYAALPEPGRSVPTDGQTAPLTPLESRMAELWAQTLGLDSVGAHEDFFALGGNSIKATRIASRIRQEWQVEFSVRTVLESGTVAGCAAALGEPPAHSVHEPPAT
ncbi:non-ribosomal peptide synthetase [Streptomyces platensis]|uniref:Linear gramicidin synthase subunit D n=1 Tax=Streptomyces platensis TaxID=58346 RepID=A0AAE6TKD4_STRPT|nr:non-ribosomal peptide synthetase [Streptomyces platensis]OSY47455.1 Linear gramicidin synthase subunit D [Streptomyces platensis]QEV50554.1 non-ribosomal peptide synthetase [Streptomyces platensis]